MAIQGKKINVAGPLHAATSEGMLTSASEIHVDANNDSLDKAVIGDIKLDEAINMNSSTASKILNCEVPTYYRIKSGNSVVGTCQFFAERNRFSIVQIIYTNYFISPEEVAPSSVYRTYKRVGNLLLAQEGLSIWGNWSIVADENDKQEVTNISENLGLEEYPLFSETDDYIVGNVVRYTDGKLYRFKVAHTAGVWNTNEVEQWNVVRDWEDNHARILDCGNAYSRYGGARTFDCGKATN